MNKKYIDLLKNVLTDYHRINFAEYKPLKSLTPGPLKMLLIWVNKLLKFKNYVIVKVYPTTREKRLNGQDWPAHADTMIGIKRMENIEYCVRKVIEENIPGDLIETGVWRGGATIFMRALLDAYGDQEDRTVFVADSFEGLPKPGKFGYQQDAADEHYKQKELAISLDSVKNNFRKYDLLDNRVIFLKGWFKDTLRKAYIEKLSILRLDGDMYGSTMDALEALYPKVSPGGFIIVDDYYAVASCRQAVTDYRSRKGITGPIYLIDGMGVYWRKVKE